MYQLTNNSYFIETADELPELPLCINKLYLDLETSSGDPKIASLNPWKVDNCRAHLAAMTWDDNPKCYAVPRELLHDWLREVLSRSDSWANQNVKYDTHVCHNDLGIEYTGKLYDTLTLAKLVNSDRTYSGGYGLDVLAKDYCDIDLSSYYKALNPWLVDTKDYGKIRDFELADYACAQVQANRKLHAKLESLLPEETRPVWETEKKLTTVLVAMERRGMKINVSGVKIAMLRGVYKMLELRTQMEEQLGYDFNPKSNPECQDLFLIRYGLPPMYKEKNVKGVITRVSKGPSFDVDVLETYLRVQPVGSVVHDLVEKTLRYRHLDTMNGLFWQPWLDLHVDGILHSDNNQNVRSGRMSCKMPNNQQFNDEARALIEPREGHVLTVHDYSQIEYRMIVHYIQNKMGIETYNNDPKTDWHKYIADSLGIGRDSAKTLNFAICYGMGKAKTVGDLIHNPDMVKIYGNDPILLRQAALRCHRELHERLPELRANAKQAENAARKFGYVKNAYGRRLHLNLAFAHHGFSRVCQSHAADLIKERAVALEEKREKYGAYMLALVHDEVVSEVPVEHAQEYMDEATETLNQSSVYVRVPVRCSNGMSDKSWLAAKKGEKSDAKSEQSQPATTTV